MWESQGVTVSRLMRVRFGPLGLPRTLRPGHYRELETDDINLLRRAVGLSDIAPHVPLRRRARPNAHASPEHANKHRADDRARPTRERTRTDGAAPRGRDRTSRRRS